MASGADEVSRFDGEAVSPQVCVDEIATSCVNFRVRMVIQYRSRTLSCGWD